MKTPILINAAEMARQHPTTFQRPSARQIRRLHPGDLVKVNASGERFWCEIQTRNGDHFVGRVDNELIGTARHGLGPGDLFEFHADNIYSFEPAQAAPPESGGIFPIGP